MSPGHTGPVTLELRPVDREHAEAFVRAISVAFGATAAEDDIAWWVETFEPDFSIGIFDQGRIVAGASADPLEMTLPAGSGETMATMPVAGVTAVGVAPTHRRQGLMTRLMHHQLADLAGRGYSLAVLLASESILYGQFGYGPAQWYQSLAIERTAAAFRPEPTTGAPVGRVRLVEPEEAAKLLPSLHDRARRRRPGELDRNTRWWDRYLQDPPQGRDGGGARQYAVHESAGGEADGWISYRYHRRWSDEGLATGRVDVDDLGASDPAATAALWRLVLGLDLASEITARARPLDEPLSWLLANPRRLRTTAVGDHLWVRLLDIPAALAARGYGATERLVLDVTPAAPSDGGRFVLESGPTSGSCRPATRREKAQLVLGTAELGAIYLGGVAPSVLAAAGRVTELQTGALAAADRVFPSPVAPFCTLDF